SKVPFPVEIAGFPDFSRPVPVYPAFLKYVVPVQPHSPRPARRRNTLSTQRRSHLKKICVTKSKALRSRLSAFVKFFLHLSKFFLTSAEGKRTGPEGPALSLSKNLCLKQLGCILQGEYEGAGAPSCGIKCLQKACASRRLRRAAADFRAAERPENRGIVKAVEKVRRTVSTA
ncbi:hypothetical protein, partial [Dysosmobacter sp.]|uniref:hypothetical protein n=1 Tax=Dysosmobacter sp. TaxID=2591382 RepID=UPI002A875A77